MTESTMRGVVICPKFAVTGRKIELSCDVEPTALRRYLLYWDKVAYAYPNGLGKPNFDALHDIRFLSEYGVLSLHDIPVGTPDIGMDEIPSPVKLSEASSLISSGQPTTENPSGMLVLGSPAHIWPQLSTFAQLQVATKVAPNDGGIWTIGEYNAQLSTVVYPNALGQFLEATLYASLPVPTDATPLDDIMEFRARRKGELLQLRRAIDRLHAVVMSQPDSERAVERAKEEIELGLNQLHRTLREARIRTFFSTIKLCIATKESTMSAALFSGLAAGVGLPLEVGAIAGLTVNSMLTFAIHGLDASRGLPAELSDFAYLYDIEKYWPSADI